MREVVSRDILRILTERARFFDIVLDDVSITQLTFSKVGCVMCYWLCVIGCIMYYFFLLRFLPLLLPFSLLPAHFSPIAQFLTAALLIKNLFQPAGCSCSCC